MTEAVIVAAGRTAIGRANKGSLVDCRPDDLSALIVDDVLNKVPQLDRHQVEDIIWGCAQPAGEAGTNIARVTAILAGMPDVPGTTANRYCSSSLQTIRMAAHAIKAGEGDVFVSGGVETVSRFQFGMADGGPKNTKFEPAVERTAERASEEDELRAGRRAHRRAVVWWRPGVDTEQRTPRRVHRHRRDGRERGAVR